MLQSEISEQDSLYLTPAEYLSSRVEEQLAWYSSKSAINKRWYYRLQSVTLLAAVAIPVISLSSGEFPARFAVALLGAVAALAAGMLSMFQSRDQWLDYRSTAESLKFEKHCFLTRTAPYAADDAYPLFVQRVETIILSENRNWRQKGFSLPSDKEVDVSGSDSPTKSVPIPAKSE